MYLTSFKMNGRSGVCAVTSGGLQDSSMSTDQQNKGERSSDDLSEKIQVIAINKELDRVNMAQQLSREKEENEGPKLGMHTFVPDPECFVRLAEEIKQRKALLLKREADLELVKASEDLYLMASRLDDASFVVAALVESNMLATFSYAIRLTETNNQLKKKVKNDIASLKHQFEGTDYLQDTDMYLRKLINEHLLDIAVGIEMWQFYTANGTPLQSNVSETAPKTGVSVPVKDELPHAMNGIGCSRQ